jgi:hypothetical protein
MDTEDNAYTYYVYTTMDTVYDPMGHRQYLFKKPCL